MQTPLLLGGGDLASGVAYRLYKARLPFLIVELPMPTMVRRLVSFAEAVYTGAHTVEGITARRVEEPSQVDETLRRGEIPVLVDPALERLRAWGWVGARPIPILIDARIAKRPPEYPLSIADLVIGLGPGFTAGENCHAVIETNRGHFLGRVYWEGSAEADTGLPEAVLNHQADRVLRAPADGSLTQRVPLGARVSAGQVLAEVDGHPVRAPFDGVLRGMMHSGLRVTRGLKIGDVDPRNDPRYARAISEKALAIGGGVLEAILTTFPPAWTI
ncbi:MAG TPA: EF2563 family selenium-dependent molybdenum hydroxylase system protein [Chloroflexi bacterium]|nr:EF2563 family selenium-dependent molybdenum hydroxylase system protein [Chloroflexota bacterium]